MAQGRPRKGGRREPLFDAAPGPGVGGLALDPGDRVGGPLSEEVDRPRRRTPAQARERRRTATDDRRRPSRGRGDEADTAEERRPRRKRGGSGGGRKSRSGLGRLVYWGLVVTLWGVIAAIGLLIWVGAHLPSTQSLEVPKRPPSIQILGLTGTVLATRGDMGGAAVPLKEMPAYLPNAFLAIEDRRFYGHFGIDPFGIARALVANVLRRGVSQGGSTITQQLAKNLFLTQERTVERKLQEVVLALWLEGKFSKKEILELYLNRVYFGSGAYGVEAAAQRYFGKSARRVTLAEAALLAGLVKSPSRLAPTRNFDGAERRGQVVLASMSDAGFIDDATAKSAMTHPPRIVQPTAGGSVNYVADWVMDVLNDLIGRVEQDIVVDTTVDPVVQAAAEKALLEEMAQKGQKFAVSQGALVAMTPDGAVRALVGGRSYADSQFNRAVAAKRQPGSAFKPFVYLAALERGLTPDTVREDRPIDIKGWKPENYSREYFGPVTLTRALSLSLNTVAVRVGLEVGPKSVVRVAHRLGIASKLDPNPSIALGTSEVSVLELVAAYAPFANGGIGIAPHIVARVRSAGGKVLYQSRQPYLGRVLDARHVGMMNAMLQETLSTGTARKAEVPGWHAAGKTGTSQDFRDAWFVGYTGHLVAGVWLGNDDNSPTRKTTGGGLPAEIWSRFMKAAHQGQPVADLPGAPRGGFTLPGFGPPEPAPVPQTTLPPVSPPQAAPPPGTPAARSNIRPEADAGLDGWLLERLFGRR